ncbi:MAG: succinate dehydrogenase/fumarate reductase iron-sulfur subunit [Spirochaetia bacterium]|nr:succinate dehydrogenase/fumarate reductase iron-sulfur subunit [Spirochaetia bacterium]
MDEKKEISFRVQRFDPQLDTGIYYDNFRITIEKGVTILRALNYIKDNIDSKLTFRVFCQAGICGSCAMRVNGVSKLACMTQVWTELETSSENDLILIEPIKNFSLIRDLVVEMEPLVEKLKNYYSWVKPKMPASEMGKKEFSISEETFQKYDQATDCILCASCVSECLMMEVNPEYISPVILLKSYRMNVDERDAMNEVRLKKVASDKGVWDCTHCYKCVEHCVKNIDIMKGIHELRHEAMTKGLHRSEGAKHAQAFFNDIKRKGHLVEATLIPRTLGIFKTLKMVPTAIKMFFKGRMPPVFVRSIPHKRYVKKIYKNLKKGNYSSKR